MPRVDKKYLKLGVLALAVIALIVGLSVGITQSKKNKTNTSASQAVSDGALDADAVDYDHHCIPYYSKGGKSGYGYGGKSGSKGGKSGGYYYGGHSDDAYGDDNGYDDRRRGRRLVVPGTEEYLPRKANGSGLRKLRKELKRKLATDDGGMGGDDAAADEDDEYYFDDAADSAEEDDYYYYDDGADGVAADAAVLDDTMDADTYAGADDNGYDGAAPPKPQDSAPSKTSPVAYSAKGAKPIAHHGPPPPPAHDDYYYSDKGGKSGHGYVSAKGGKSGYGGSSKGGKSGYGSGKGGKSGQYCVPQYDVCDAPGYPGHYYGYGGKSGGYGGKSGSKCGKSGGGSCDDDMAYGGDDDGMCTCSPYGKGGKSGGYGGKSGGSKSGKSGGYGYYSGDDYGGPPRDDDNHGYGDYMAGDDHTYGYYSGKGGKSGYGYGGKSGSKGGKSGYGQCSCAVPSACPVPVEPDCICEELKYVFVDGICARGCDIEEEGRYETPQECCEDNFMLGELCIKDDECPVETPAPTPSPTEPCVCEELMYAFIDGECVRYCGMEEEGKYGTVYGCCDASFGSGVECITDDECPIATDSTPKPTPFPTPFPSPAPVSPAPTFPDATPQPTPEPTTGSTPTVSTEVTGPPTTGDREPERQ